MDQKDYDDFLKWLLKKPTQELRNRIKRTTIEAGFELINYYEKYKKQKENK